MYDIVRFYADGRSEVVRERVTLEEARAHCDLETTRQPGEWFDGYRRV